MKKDFLSVFVIVTNTLSWYFPFYAFFVNMLEKSVLLALALSIHYVGAVGFAFVGTVLTRKFSSRNSFLCFWMAVGVISSAMMIVLDVNNIAYLLFVSFLSGISLGLGFPICLAYFGDLTREDNRGRLGGIAFFASGLCMLLIGLLLSFSNLTVGMMLFTFWRGLGLILFYLTKPKQEYRPQVTEVSFKSVLINRSLVLYLVPWTMFSLVNFLEIPMISAGANALFGAGFTFLIAMSEYGIGGFIALIGGAFADSIGRKRLVISGFMVLGIAYAVLGLFPHEPLAWCLLFVLHGVAWGIFSLMFYLVIWADLAGNRAKERYYLIGVLPFIVSGYIQILLAPYTELISPSVAFSVASFFLFLAVLPLLYAPETLSEKEMEKKRLKKYLEDVKKIKEKCEK